MFISCALLFFLPGARSLLSGLHAHRVQLPPPAVSAARPSLELRSASNSGARPSSLLPLFITLYGWSLENMHQGYPKETLVRFLKAREWNVAKAHKMIVECLNWRIQNEIDSVLERPIAPVDLYKSIRDSQLIGLSRYTKEILLYNFDGGTICSVVILKEWLGIHRVAAAEISKAIATAKIIKVPGLKLSALSQIKDSGSHQVTPPHVDFADVSILVVELRTTIRCPDRERWS
uniref:CRAL/TRIO N-terminal domain-containing protein n=1 Tax=Zea mays TaxID=4577 RepID=A0A804RE94_MAIZE